MRFGSSTLDSTPHTTVGLRLHARCLVAQQAGHGVVRIPQSYIAPLDDTTCIIIRQLLVQHRLRCVIHAPITAPHTIVSQLAAYADFLYQLGADDGVIICHMTSATAHDWRALSELPTQIQRYVAVELTNQSIDALCGYGVPIIFDWLHYHVLSPWPYLPVASALQCTQTWRGRRPLIHLSSPDTADDGNSHPHGNGRHSDYLDWATLMHFIGQLSAHAGDTFDIEVEARAGAKAVAHFLQQCQQHTPPHWQHLWQSSTPSRGQACSR